MPFVAGSITVGDLIIKKAEEPALRNGAGSFQELRNKVYKQIIKENTQATTQSILTPPPKKIREVNDTLIQYKESAFLSDMLSSSKD